VWFEADTMGALPHGTSGAAHEFSTAADKIR